MRKKLLLLSFRSGLLCLFLFLSASIAGAQVKKIAVLETVDKEGNVPYAVKVMVRSNLTTAITNTPGYEAYDRIDVSQIMGEQSFQRSGLVSDEQIKRLGEIAGVEFILIAEAVIFDQTSIFVTAKVLNVETAKTELSENGLMAMTAADIQHGCESLAQKLLGVPASSETSKASPSQKSSNASGQVKLDFVDLGLSVKWANCNVGALTPEGNSSFMNFDAVSAIRKGRRRCPTDAEWTELRVNCSWEWTAMNGVNGMKVTSPDTGNSIFLPAAGYRDMGGSLNNPDSSGFYLSSSGYLFGTAWGVTFDSGGVSRNNLFRMFGCSVRLVTEY